MPSSDLDQLIIDAGGEKAFRRLYGITSASEGGRLFCGVTEEAFAINGQTYAWPKGSHLTWTLGFSRLGGLGDLDLKKAYADALAEIASVCDISHEYTSNPRTANLLCNSTRLDGPSGILADMQIPVGSVRPDATQLMGRFDDCETWTLAENPGNGQIDFYRVALHELLHAHGLGHAPSSLGAPALIAPMYSTKIRHLQAADIGELQRRYGQPKVKPPAPPSVPTDPIGDSVGVNIIIEYMGKQVQFTGKKPFVVKQNLEAIDLQ